MVSTIIRDTGGLDHGGDSRCGKKWLAKTLNVCSTNILL